MASAHINYHSFIVTAVLICADLWAPKELVRKRNLSYCMKVGLEYQEATPDPNLTLRFTSSWTSIVHFRSKRVYMMRVLCFFNIGRE
jgi:hypothetical protein